MTRQHCVKCACGRTIGVRIDEESFEVQHQGRTVKINGTGSVEITCEECGQDTTFTLNSPPVAVV